MKLITGKTLDRLEDLVTLADGDYDVVRRYFLSEENRSEFDFEAAMVSILAETLKKSLPDETASKDAVHAGQ